MNEASRDGASVRLPPPLVFVGALAAGALLHVRVVPVPLPLDRTPRILLAVAVGLAGAGLMAGAIRLFRKTEQDPAPWKSTPEIVIGGVYRYTRNPMYVGMALLQVCFGVGFANGWILALTPVSLAVVYLTAVRHEEAYLERKFGESYVDYTATVRRWF